MPTPSTFPQYLRPIAVLALAAASWTAHADAFSSPEQAREHTDKVMALAGKGQVKQAFELIAPFVIGEKEAWLGAALQVAAQLDNAVKRDGPTTGFDFIRQEKAGPSLVRFVYLVKTDKSFQPWSFDYYKTSQGWGATNFNIGDKVRLFDTAQ